MSGSQIITLVTDFGVADGYVGAMKGVILDIAPQVRLVDITHDIGPQDVRQAAYMLYTTYRFFPSRTIHLVVVDPGVGGSRRPIALHTSSGAFVGPDNGVFSYVMAEETVDSIVEIANPRYRLPHVSDTFHGRDIFAPAAAHLATGIALDNLGPVISERVTFAPPHLEISTRRVAGEVLHIDHFGNVTTSIGRLLWRGDRLSLNPAFRRQSDEEASIPAQSASIVVGGRKIHGLCRAYADAERGDLIALVGSGGHVEVAVREGSAAHRLRLQQGDPVQLSW